MKKNVNEGGIAMKQAIEEGSKNRRINIAKFEEYLKSKHLNYLRA